MKDFSKHAAETAEIAAFFVYSHFQLTITVGLSIQVNCRPTLKKRFVFRLEVFAATLRMPYVHIRHFKLDVS